MAGGSDAMLAIAGGKGGCGKTTVTLGLAWALERRGHDPLVVDGDPDMPDVHHRLALPGKGGVDRLADGEPLEAVLAYSRRLPRVPVVTGGRRGAVGPALRRLGSWSGTVLVDCPPGANPDSLRPLRHANRSVLVSTAGPRCIEATERTEELARRLDAPPVGVVVRTLAGDASNPIPADWTVLGTLPPVDEPPGESQVRAAFERISRSISPDNGYRARGWRPDTSTRYARPPSELQNHD